MKDNQELQDLTIESFEGVPMTPQLANTFLKMCGGRPDKFTVYLLIRGEFGTESNVSINVKEFCNKVGIDRKYFMRFYRSKKAQELCRISNLNITLV